MGERSRKYGTQTTIGFPMVMFNSTSFLATPTINYGDCMLSKNSGAFANVTNTPTQSGLASKFMLMTLTAAEMQAQRVCVKMIDQSATKQWTDNMILITTYGDSSALELFDRSAIQTNISNILTTVNAIRSSVAVVDTVSDNILITVNAIRSSIGVPTAIDSGAPSVVGILKKLADDNGGASFDATTDSQRAMASAVTASAPVAGSSSSGGYVSGTTITGNHVQTRTQDGVYWEMQTTGALPIDVNIGYSIGTGKGAYQIRVIGKYVVTAPITNKWVDIYAYNYVTSAYDKISSTSTRINGQTGSVDNTYVYNLNANHLKTDGTASIRFLSNNVGTTSSLYLDYVPYYFTSTGASPSDIANAVYLKMKNTVYRDGVWIDTLGTITGTNIGYEGIPSAPVNNLSDAYSIASALGVKKFYFRPDSLVTFTQSMNYWTLDGRAFINLSGQSIEDVYFKESELISGIGIGDDAYFENCQIGTISIDVSTLINCGLNGLVSIGSGSELTAYGCYDHLAMGLSAPRVHFSNNSVLGARDYRGGIELCHMSSTTFAKIDGAGRVVIRNDCTGGEVVLRGFFSVTDNSGLVTITEDARYNITQPVGSVTDPVEINTVSMNTVTSAIDNIDLEVDTITANVELILNAVNTLSSNLTLDNVAKEVWQTVIEYLDIDETTQKEKAHVMLQAIFSVLKQRMTTL